MYKIPVFVGSNCYEFRVAEVLRDRIGHYYKLQLSPGLTRDMRPNTVHSDWNDFSRYMCINPGELDEIRKVAQLIGNPSEGEQLLLFEVN